MGVSSAAFDQTQQTATLHYGACTTEIDNLTKYGGAAYEVVSVGVNPDRHIKALLFAMYDVGDEVEFIEASYLDANRMRGHDKTVDHNGGWVVIASRMALNEVRCRLFLRSYQVKQIRVERQSGLPRS
jgi:hypothetical protein